MVRIKHRYLLLNILYPESYPKDDGADHINQRTTLPGLLQFHRPTPDELTPQLLARAIRDQILYLYGNYGYGITSTGVNGQYPPSLCHFNHIELLTVVPSSQVSLSGNFNSDHSMLKGELPSRVGCTDVYDAFARITESIHTATVCHAGGPCFGDYQKGRGRSN